MSGRKIGLLVTLAVAVLCAPAMAASLDSVPQHTLPPGDVSGRLLESDGVTPHGNVKVTLRNAETDEEVMSTMADANGKYTLRNVPVGEYIVFIGNPGLGAVLKVVAGAEAGTLTIVVPKALSLPFLEGLPAWLSGEDQELGKGLAFGGGGIVVIGGILFWYDHDQGRRSELRRQRNSPIGPMPTWAEQLFFDMLYHGYVPKRVP